MWFKVLLIAVSVSLSVAAPSGPRSKALDPLYVKAFRAYKNLEPIRSQAELRAIATVGILNGAVEVRKSMQKRLTHSVSDLLLNSNMSDVKNVVPKIAKIEKMVERDRQAVQVLGSALDLATQSITAAEYRVEMKNALKSASKKKRQVNQKAFDVQKRVQRLKEDVLDHMRLLEETLIRKTNTTLSYLEDVQGIRRNKLFKREEEATTTESVLVDIVMKNETENDVVPKPEKIESFSLEAELQSEEDKRASDGPNGVQPAPQPGLVGLIGSLSGGDGGSDVGALIGSLTGLIARLFGPDGLDIESLISTATSLISGLLAGNKNFGTVLGQYVGTAFDGLSGGGGAINNGKFVGNFVGTVLASLSADPEDDDKPPQPFVFLQNFVHTLVNAKYKQPSDSMSGEAADVDRSGEAWPTAPTKGFDSFGFVKQAVSSIVSTITGIVLNASLGSVGGLSSGSSSIFSSSSSPKRY